MDRSSGTWACPSPSPPMEVPWYLECCQFLGPLYPAETLNWGTNFPLEDMDMNANLEFSLAPELSQRDCRCLERTIPTESLGSDGDRYFLPGLFCVVGFGAAVSGARCMGSRVPATTSTRFLLKPSMLFA